MKRRTIEAKSGSAFGPGRALPRRHQRVGAALLLAVIALMGLAPRTLGENPWPKITVEVAKPLTETLLYRSAENAPQPETQIDFKGNGIDWSFVQFYQLPKPISLKMRGGNTRDISPGKWYPFKDVLPVTLEIESKAQPPVEIAFQFGRLNDADIPKNTEATARDVLVLANADKVVPVSEKQTLRFIWGPVGQEISAPITSAAQAPAQANTQQDNNPLPPSSSWWTYLTEENFLLGLAVLIVGLFLLVIFYLLVLRNLVRDIWHWLKRLGRKPSRGRNQRRSSPLDGIGGDDAAPITPKTTPPAPAADEIQRPSPLAASVHFNENPTLKGQGSPASQDGAELKELRREVQEIHTELRDKVGRRENLTEAAQINVSSMLANTRKDILSQIDTMMKQYVYDALKPVDELVTEHEASVRKELDDSARRIAEAVKDGEEVRKHLGDVSKELVQVERRLETRIAELQTAVEKRTVPDSFYARTLGAVLGQHIEALQDGNFERLMGEQINQFFQSGVARSEELQQLRTRVEEINFALKVVSDKMEKLNPQATDEARQHIQRVEALVKELGGLQAQLQSRRGTIETTLRIPVSMHAGARQTFLDELGRGIRREIDKLNAPESYFEGELERLITADLIAVVDICDKKVAPPPGTRAELEGALKHLFEKSGLRPILPRQGEPFNTNEQDLIETISGGPSLTVAQVVTRGFYYKHRDSETLLRKAGVTVYR